MKLAIGSSTGSSLTLLRMLIHSLPLSMACSGYSLLYAPLTISCDYSQDGLTAVSREYPHTVHRPCDTIYSSHTLSNFPSPNFILLRTTLPASLTMGWHFTVRRCQIGSELCSRYCTCAAYYLGGRVGIDSLAVGRKRGDRGALR